MSDIVEEEIKKDFEANMLDGNKVEDCGKAMLSAEYVYEYLRSFALKLRRETEEQIGKGTKARVWYQKGFEDALEEKVESNDKWMINHEILHHKPLPPKGNCTCKYGPYECIFVDDIYHPVCKQCGKPLNCKPEQIRITPKGNQEEEYHSIDFPNGSKIRFSNKKLIEKIAIYICTNSSRVICLPDAKIVASEILNLIKEEI